MFGNKMKALVAIALVLAAGVPVFAGTSGSIIISGTVSASFTSTVTPTSDATSLPIAAGASKLAIATFSTTCNAPAGYSVSITTANNGVLKGGNSSNTDTIAYTLALGSTTVSLGTAFQPLTTKTSSSGDSQTLYITFTGLSNPAADTYGDTIYYTVASK